MSDGVRRTRQAPLDGGGMMVRALRSTVVAVLTLVVLAGLAFLTHVVAALTPYGVALLLQDRMTPEIMLAVAVVMYLAGVAATAATLTRMVSRLRPYGLAQAPLLGTALFSVVSTAVLVLMISESTSLQVAESVAFVYFVQPQALLMGLVALVLWLAEARTHGSHDSGNRAGAPDQEGSVSLTTSSSDPERYPSRSCVT